MIIGKGVMIKNTKYPLGWAYHATLKATQNYTIALPGWYRLHVVGAGGRGGTGGRARTATNNTGMAISSGGASGSTGAYAVHEVFLEYGQIINIAIAAGKSSVVVKGAEVNAIDGIVGYDGYEQYTNTTTDRAADPVSPPNPVGVIASGGNVANIGGVIGNGSRHSGNNPTEHLFGGLSNVIADTVAIYTPKVQAEGNAESTDLKLGGGGAGGRGVATFNTSWQSGVSGWNGGIGGVVLERGRYA